MVCTTEDEEEEEASGTPRATGRPLMADVVLGGGFAVLSDTEEGKEEWRPDSLSTLGFLESEWEEDRETKEAE